MDKGFSGLVRNWSFPGPLPDGVEEPLRFGGIPGVELVQKVRSLSSQSSELPRTSLEVDPLEVKILCR